MNNCREDGYMVKRRWMDVGKTVNSEEKVNGFREDGYMVKRR
jgi:hypothetical protein